MSFLSNNASKTEGLIGLTKGVSSRSWPLFTIAMIVLGVVSLLYFLEGGRKIFLRTLWTIDRLLGGAPHSTDLPGPPGLPVVGNLFDVNTVTLCPLAP